jgi:hypothetical protein
MDEEVNVPQVGWWATVCCEDDLEQITDEETLRLFLMWDADADGGLRHRYWPTREAALDDLR